jgi:tRNA wybutosine-synthesizing protein 3
LDTRILQEAFLEKKILNLKKLGLAKISQRVDSEVIELIDLINSFEEYYTTSSCAGRFVILSKNSFRGKYTAEFVFKTHSPKEILFEKVKNAINQDFIGYLYLNVEPPTFHIACNNLENAIRLHQIAIDENIGYSMFKTIKKSIIVEVRGTGMIQMPIGFQGNLFVSDEYLQEILKLSNEILTNEQARIFQFQNKLINLKNI